MLDVYSQGLNGGDGSGGQRGRQEEGKRSERR
jgi:hypothetical protein